jgi:Fe2+ transport system protein B
MRLSVFLFLFLLACKPAMVDDDSNTKKTDYSALNLQASKMTLVGEAQKQALQWQAFQDLLTGIENYDHSIGTTNSLISHVDKMLENPKKSFQDQSITSRIKVLKTRLHIYKSFLGYRIKTKEAQELKYNYTITALDELLLQINLRVNQLEKSNEQLLMELKEDLDPE